MDMTTISHQVGVSTQMAVLILLIYPFALWALSRYRVDGVGPISASAIPAILVPLFIGASASCVVMSNVIVTLATYGDAYSASGAAGVAEAQVPLLCAAIDAAFISFISLVRGFAPRVPAVEAPAAHRRLPALAAGLVALLAGVLLALIFAVENIFGRFASRTPSLQVPVAGAWIAGAGALASIVWLVASRRSPVLQFSRSRTTVSTVCLATTLLLSYAVWSGLNIFRDFAVHG
jgi:hypothetical protein